MKGHNSDKKGLKPKTKNQTGETFHHGKLSNDKVKYNHKNHWLEEEFEEIVSHKLKKKKKTL